MKKKLALLVIAVAGVLAMAQTCVILGATVVVIDDEVWYSAEIKNETQADMLNHSMAVGFIKGSGLAVARTVDQDGDTNGVICLRSLQSGASNFFSANSKMDDNDVDTAISRLVGPLTFGDVADADITFSVIDVTRDEETMVVNGRIRNNNSDSLEDLRVCVVVRNKDGDVTRVDVDDDEYDLDEDETADFSITTTVPDDEDDVDEVDLYVDGINADDDDKVTEPVSDLANNVTNCEDVPTATKTSTATATETNTPTPTTTPVAATNTPTATPEDAC